MKAQIEVRVVLVLTMEIENMGQTVFQLAKEAELKVHNRLQHMIKENSQYSDNHDMEILPPVTKLKAQE